MKAIGEFFEENWVRMLVIVSVLLVSYLLLFRGIESLTGAYYSPGEVMTLQSAQSLEDIWQNPLNAPHKLVVWSLTQLQSEWGVLATRVASALFAVLSTILFYWSTAHIFSRRIAMLTTPLFVVSALLLHASRYGEPFILQLAPLILLAGVFLYQRARHQTIALYALAVIFGLALYSPGAIWFAVLGLALLWPALQKITRVNGKLHSLLAALVLLLVLTPIGVAAIQDYSALLAFAAIPSAVPTWPDTLENIKRLGEALVYRSYFPPTYALHGAPLFNIAEITLFIGGIIALCMRPRLRVNYYIIGGFVLSVALIIVGGGATIAMLAPFMYLAIAGGLFMLLDQWLTVFPRNPIARMAGVLFCAVVVIFSVLYHARAYYVAWPNAPETEQALSVKRT